MALVQGKGILSCNSWIIVSNNIFILSCSDYLFKLLLIGDSGVGKSCLLLRFAVSICNMFVMLRVLALWFVLLTSLICSLYMMGLSWTQGFAKVGLCMNLIGGTKVAIYLYSSDMTLLIKFSLLRFYRMIRMWKVTSVLLGLTL